MFTDFNTKKDKKVMMNLMKTCINFLIIVFMVKALKMQGRKLM